MSIEATRRQFLAQAALLGGVSAALQHPILAAERAPGATAPKGEAGSSEKVPLAPPDAQPPKLSLPEGGRKLGYAIVGLGELSVEEILPAFRECQHARPTALVSGHPEKAKRLAEAYGVEANAIYNYENFDKLKDDPRVDVIYIVLPNSMHAEFTIRGLQAGKHVLCEKPMAPSLAECEKMIAAAQAAGKQLGVAYRLHYEPLNLKVMELCRQKAFGQVKTFSSTNNQNTPAPNIRLSKKLGGGPVGDVGVYSINAARYCIGEEPVEIAAFANFPKGDPRFREVPESVAYTMRYPSGVLAQCDCSFGTTESRRYRVNCTDGYIEMDPAFSYRGLKLFTQAGEAKKDSGQRSELQIRQVNHFASEMDHFAVDLMAGKPVRTPGELGLADMKIVLAVMEAAESGQIVRLAQ